MAWGLKLGLLPVPDVAKPGVSLSLEGVWANVGAVMPSCRGAGQRIQRGFSLNWPSLHLLFQPHDEQILPCKFPQQTVPAPLHPGLWGEQGGYVGLPVSLEGLKVFYLHYSVSCSLGILTFSPVKQPSQRLASCSLPCVCSQPEPLCPCSAGAAVCIFVHQWMLSLCAAQKQIPECYRNGALAAAQCAAVI